MWIDLKYALPFAMPFVFLVLLRALYWLAAAEWSEPGLAAIVSLFAGQFVGWIATAAMRQSGVTCVVRFPAARQSADHD